MKRQLVLIVHNVRSALNAGSLLRTAEGLGVEKAYLTDYTPYPTTRSRDQRLPHVAARASRQIAKTALGAEKYVDWEHADTIEPVLAKLKADGYEIAALEQSISSLDLGEYKPPSKVALIVGSEVGGLDKNTLGAADVILEIPMRGRKESFNVAVAAAIALYHLSNH